MLLQVFANTISLRSLMLACRRMGTGLRAGLDLRRVLEHEMTLGAASYRARMKAIHAMASQGTSIAEAVQAQGTYFPPLFRTMVTVGERTGKLPETLLRLAEHYEHLIRLRTTYLLGIAWPALQLLVSLVVVGILIYVFGALGSNIDLLGIGYGARGLLNYVAIVGLLVFLGIVGVRLATTEGPVGQWMQQLAYRLPILGPAMIAQTMARMTWTMSMVADSDMGSRTIARTTLESTGSQVYQRCAGEIDEHLKQGEDLATAFASADVFPVDFVTALRTGELSGTLVETLSHLSRDYEARSTTAWRTVAFAASAATFLLVGGLIVFMIFRIFFAAYIAPMQEILNDMN